jgi:hypothetical protein
MRHKSGPRDAAVGDGTGLAKQRVGKRMAHEGLDKHQSCRLLVRVGFSTEFKHSVKDVGFAPKNRYSVAGQAPPKGSMNGLYPLIS